MYRELKGKDGELIEIEERMGEIIDHLKSKTVGYKNGNPKLEYKKPEFDATKIRKRLEAMGIGSSLEEQLLENKRASLLVKLDSIMNIGSSEMKDGYAGPTSDFLDYYPNSVPALNDVKKAEKILEEKEKPKEREERNIYAEQGKRELEKELKKRGFLDWNIIIVKPKRGENMPRIAVYRKGKRMELNEDTYKASERELEKQNRHEIGVHIFRYEKGLLQPLPGIFSWGLDGRYLLTEEGLTKIVEKKYNLLDSLKPSAAHLIAVDAMIKGASYQDVLKLLKQKGLEEKKAQEIALRVKRGLIDTSKPGGFPKDSLYLLGLYKIEDYIDKGGDMNLLGLGKVGIEHVPILEKLVEKGFIKKSKFLF